MANPTTLTVNYEDLAVAWHDGQHYNPATRHRRRLMIQLLRDLPFRSVVEIGCGQPYLLEEIAKSRPVDGLGTDISRALIAANKKEFPHLRFAVLDIAATSLPRQFDVVIASEVLEHIGRDQKALANMAKMAKHYLLITVPSSPVFPIDRMIGHYRHYRPAALTARLRKLGFTPLVCLKWGFPFHSLYKYAINLLAPRTMRHAFAESHYTGVKKLLSSLIYGLFFLNLKRWGFQLIILAQRPPGQR